LLILLDNNPSIGKCQALGKRTKRQKPKTHKTENLKSALVHFTPAVGNDADNDLFPSFGAPRLGAITGAQMGDVLDHAMVQSSLNKEQRMSGGYIRVHGANKKDFVFVVHRHYNEKFCLAAVEIGTKRVLGGHEMIGVTGSSGISEFSHFFDVTHTLWHDMGWDDHVKDEVTVLQLDLANGSALHEFVPSNGVAWDVRVVVCSKPALRGIVCLVRAGRVGHRGYRGCIVYTDLAHLVGIEVRLGTSIVTVVRFRIPIGLCVVFVVRSGVLRGIIGCVRILRLLLLLLAIVRITILSICHVKAFDKRKFLLKRTRTNCQMKRVYTGLFGKERK
jgi:hypothetical protein